MTALRSLVLGVAILSSGLGLASCLVSCGEGGPAHAPTAPSVDLDGDAIALLPPGAVAAVTVDMRAFYDSKVFGAQVATLAESMLPVGVDAGFVPSRDVDRVTAASYALQGADAVAVLRGRFDAAAIDKAARAHAATHSSEGILASTPYSGHTMYTVANIGFAVLTSKTVLAGTGAGLRLALDRIRDGRVRPELSPAILETLQTKDVAMAGAADFSGSPLGAVQGLPLPSWAAAIKAIRGTATFGADSKVKVAGSIAFDGPPNAAAASNAMRQLATLVNTMAVAGIAPKLQDATFTPEGASVGVTFAVDDGALRALFLEIPQWVTRPKAGAGAASNEAH
jgi:hypothetical protein